MVAIITGKGVGIENSSVAILGSKGQFGSAALGRSGESVYVDGATGNLLLTTVDEMLVGRGPDAVVSRTYNSLGAWDGDNDDYWRASSYRRVYNLTGTYGNAGSTVTRTDWDGSDTLYTWSSSYTDGVITGAYVATDGEGAYDTLTKSSNVWTWTDGATRVTEAYDANNSGRISLSARQSQHFPYLARNGGVIVGNNGRGLGLRAGTPIGPLDVQRVHAPSILEGGWWGQ